MNALSVSFLTLKHQFLSLLGLILLLLEFSTNTSKPQNNFNIANHVVSLSDSNKLYLPDDLEVTLWAESPLFYNPTNIDVDIKGRIWITEAVNYRTFKDENKKGLLHSSGDRVMILEDSDGDGKADKSKVFVQDKDLISPLGIAVIGNKVIVSCSPNLIVYTDENGDDKPDSKEILLNGFGGLDHDHSLHSLIAGPDGNWYFNVGNAGPHIVTDKSGFTLRSGSIYTGGTPYNERNEGNMKSDDGRVWTGGLALRMTPEGKNLKVLGHNFRNSYEVAIDSYGNLWQNDNDDQVITCRTSFLMENGNAGYFSADGTRTWQADRRTAQDMFTAHWHQEDPGIMPAGDNTGAGSPTGMVVYEGDELGKTYRGMLLSCEAGRNVIFSYLPQAKGAGFTLNRNDLVSSQGSHSSERYEWYETGQDKTKWFRPSDICVGTDGALYIADWYDAIVGGHAMHDTKGYGRIYRVTPKGKKLNSPKIYLSTDNGRLKALKSPAINVRNLAFLAFKEEGKAAIPTVKTLLDSENPFHRARAIWLLANLGEEGIDEVQKLIESSDVNTRLVAFRALRQMSDFIPIAEKLSNDPDPAIRREVAIAIRDVKFDICQNIILNLLKNYDGQDPWMLEAIGTACDRKEALIYPFIQDLWKETPEFWNQQKANLLWRLHPAAALPDLKIRATLPKVPEPERKKALVAIAFVNTRDAAETMTELIKSKLKDVATQALYWVNFRKTNDWQEFIDETQTTQLLTPHQKQLMAQRAKLQDEKIPLQEKINLAQKMAKDPEGGSMLIDMKVQEQLNNDLTTAVSEQIYTNPDTKVRILASQFFPRNGQHLKIDFVTRIKANTEKGKAIFTQYCANCHRHGENGQDIGPNLSNIHQKYDKINLLDAIINPSANIVLGYEAYTITTTKGQTYVGFLLGSGNSLTLKDLSGQTFAIKATDIRKKEKMPYSLMPEPTTLGMNEQDLADLTGYLLGFK